MLVNAASLKVIVGAGLTSQPGFLALTESQLDVTDARQWCALFVPNSLESIVAEHVWEHLTIAEGEAAARNCFRYLAPGGTLRIAVPDCFNPDPIYLAWVRPVTGFNGSDHRVCYNYRLLMGVLRRAGFSRFRMLEFFDERGSYFQASINPERGWIKRTSGTLWGWLLSLFTGSNYTSLIVDAIK